MLYIVKYCFTLLAVGATLSFAGEMRITGRVCDTVLETSATSQPLVRIVPHVACSLVIEASCTESIVIDRYFAKTDADGAYSVVVNLPETCPYPLYLLRITGYSNRAAKYEWYGSIKPEDVPAILTVNPPQPIISTTDSVQIAGYRNYFSVRLLDELIYRNDTLEVSHMIKGVTDEQDTLWLAKCPYTALLLTSRGDTVYDSTFDCSSTNLQKVYLENGWYQQHKLNIVLPDNLEERFSDYAHDRQLTLVFRVSKPDIEYVRFTRTFKVIDLKSDLTTSTSPSFPGRLPKVRVASGMLLQNDCFLLTISTAGTYTVDLFTPGGKALQTLAVNRFFPEGSHKLSFHAPSALAPGMIMARIHQLTTGVTEVVHFVNR